MSGEKVSIGSSIAVALKCFGCTVHGQFRRGVEIFEYNVDTLYFSGIWLLQLIIAVPDFEKMNF